MPVTRAHVDTLVDERRRRQVAELVEREQPVAVDMRDHRRHFLLEARRADCAEQLVEAGRDHAAASDAR